MGVTTHLTRRSSSMHTGRQRESDSRFCGLQAGARNIVCEKA
jgi:hypothetical protein